MEMSVRFPVAKIDFSDWFLLVIQNARRFKYLPEKSGDRGDSRVGRRLHVGD